MSHLVQIDFHPDKRTLRGFGHVAFVAFGLLAWLGWHDLGVFAFGLGAAKTAVVSGLAALGVVALVLGWVWPAGNRWLYVGLSLLTFPIGFVLSYVILAVIFFGVLAPVGWLLRSFGRDPLHRAYDKTATSYWTESGPRRPDADYFRQF